MSRKTKIILGIILGFAGLFIILIIGGSIIALLQGAAQKGGSAKTSLPPASASLKSSGFSQSEALDNAGLAAEAMPPTAAPREGSGAGNIIEKKIIKTGNLEITVNSVDKTAVILTDIANRVQGFVQSSYVYESESGVKIGSVVLKIPVAQFEIVFNEIKDLAKVVVREQVSGQDVTEEYVDLQAQLKNAQAEEQQYLEIMKKAAEIEDILKVTSALSIVRGKIERLQGQLQYLANMTDMSTLTVELSEETRVASGLGKWQPYETFKKASKTLISAFQKTIDRLIWILVFAVGFFLPLGFIIWLIVKVMKGRRKHEA